MFKWLTLFLCLAVPAAAQGVIPGGGGGYNTFCVTQAPGTNNNTCASTAFVQALVSGGGVDAATLLTKTWAAPGTIGSTTPSTGAFTTLSASSTVSGAGFSAYLASPPAIGGTAPAAGTFTTLSGTTSVSGGTGSFTTLSASNVTTLAAGTTSIAPLKFQSGTNLTTAQAGAAEYDGTAFYLSPQASNRAVVGTRHFVALTSNNTLTNNTSAQPMFDGGGGPTNGRLTLSAGTYRFTVNGHITGLSGSSHSLTYTFGGTATIGSMAGTSITSVAIAVIAGFSSNSVPLQSATTATTSDFIIEGIVRITGGGTLIPQLTQGTASAAANVLTNSTFEIYPLGSSSVAYVGAWD